MNHSSNSNGRRDQDEKTPHRQSKGKGEPGAKGVVRFSTKLEGSRGAWPGLSCIRRE